MTRLIVDTQGARLRKVGERLAGPLSKHSALRARQTLAASDPAQALPVARAMVAGKLRNQATVLRRYVADSDERVQRAVEIIAAQVERAGQAADLETLRGHEGSGAAAYFRAWPALFDAERWRFHGRAYYPPPDPLNAMLSLTCPGGQCQGGYTLLLNDVVSAVYRIGLDPDIGFFHALDYGRPSLALDLEEEFRPVIVDTLALSLVRNQVLEPGDFRQEEGERPRALMTDDARRFFIQSYEERMGVRVRHPAWEQMLTYRQCIERQVEHLARCILGRDATYDPLLIQ